MKRQSRRLPVIKRLLVLRYILREERRRRVVALALWCVPRSCGRFLGPAVSELGLAGEWWRWGEGVLVVGVLGFNVED
jgi:hypothetical protein